MDRYGGGFAGRATDETRLRFARDKSDERTAQTISHLSPLLHDALRAVEDEVKDVEDVNDREIQGMLVNDRLLFASNFNDTVDNVERRFGAQMSCASW